MMAVHTLTVTCVIISLMRLCAAGADDNCPTECSCSVSRQPDSDDGGRGGVDVTCSDVHLRSLPAELPHNAVSLDVSGNRLEQLDGASLPRTGFHALSNANFSRNRITTIATESFRECASLASLDLSANRLSSVDHGTFRGAAQTSLQQLDLSGNRLTEVDGGFSGMKNLFRSVTLSTISNISYSDRFCVILQQAYRFYDFSNCRIVKCLKERTLYMCYDHRKRVLFVTV